MKPGYEVKEAKELLAALVLWTSFKKLIYCEFVCIELISME